MRWGKKKKRKKKAKKLKVQLKEMYDTRAGSMMILALLRQAFW